MAKNIKFLLDGIVGKTWMINATNHKVTGYHVNGESVYISTDKELIIKPVDDIEEFIKHSFLPVDIPKNNEIIKQDKENISKVRNVRDVLLDTIDEVKKDPAYIPKANSINQTVNTLLNTYKTELSIMKQMGK